MCDLNVQYSEESFHDITTSTHFTEFRYVIFTKEITETYDKEKDKPPKFSNPTQIKTCEYSLLPRNKELTRITIKLTKTPTPKLFTTIGNTFDIISVLPQSEKSFVDSCCSLQIDLITFDMTTSFPFKLHVPTLRTAINRGVFFEINLSCLFGEYNEKQKQNFVLNATDLISFTKGKNIILSSGAMKSNEFKGPNDLIAMGLMLGLSTSQAYNAVHVNPMKCITRSRRRFPVNSMISVLN